MLSLAKVSAAVLALASFAQATITITGTNLIGNSTGTINWTSSSIDSDPASFSIELVNTKFNNQFGVANNVPTTQNSITFQMPSVPPGPSYSIAFVAINNASDVIAMSGSFTIAENDVSSTASGTASKGTSVASTPLSIPSSAFSSAGATLTQTGPAASGTGPAVSSVGSSAASGAASAAPSSFNAATELIPSGSFAALIAGVAAFLF